jgi:hypothetical protein
VSLLATAAVKPKNPGRVAGGRKGARRRWGDPGVVHLDELTASQRRLVLALVEAALAEKKRGSDGGQET